MENLNEANKIPTLNDIPATSQHHEITTGTSEEPAPMEIILSCTICNNKFQSSTQLHNHLETDHSRDSSISGSHLTDSSQDCGTCGDKFPTEERLNLHRSSKHVQDYFNCHSCMFRFQNQQQLNNHVRECHSSASRTKVQSSSMSPVSTTAVKGSKSL